MTIIIYLILRSGVLCILHKLSILPILGPLRETSKFLILSAVEMLQHLKGTFVLCISTLQSALEYGGYDQPMHSDLSPQHWQV